MAPDFIEILDKGDTGYSYDLNRIRIMIRPIENLIRI